MTFLNSALLGGLVLASVPIIIHILNRRRFQIIDWPAMKYLKLTFKRNRRRIRIEQLILLAMRTLAVILLILAVARPIIPNNGLAGLFPGRARTSRVIVIDDSLSMGYTTAGRSAFQVARNAAEDLLHAAGAQDSATLLVTSAPERPVVRDGSLQDVAKLVDLVRGLSLTDTPNNWAAAFEGVRAALTSALYSDREVVLITDLRRSGWTSDVTAIANGLATQRIGLRIIDVGDRRTDNTALLKFAVEDTIPLPDQPIHLTAAVRNSTPQTQHGAQASLVVDGESRPVLLPDLAPGEATTVPLTLSLANPGAHALSLALGKDALPQDDVRYLAVNVRPTVSVLLVDGAPSAQPFESETDFLALAYSVGSRPWNVQRAGEFDPRRLGTTGVPDVLVLANVASLTAEQVAAIERLVQRGMGLVIFTGDLIDADLYNQRFYRDGRGLLPARLERSSETPTAGIVIEKDPQSPLAPLAKLAPAALARIRARQYQAVQMPPTPAEGVSVLARWNNSENPPAVLQKAFGKGRVLLFTTTAGKKWTDWPLDSTYLLAMRSAALAVAGGQDEGDSVTAGEAIRVLLDNNQAALDPKITVPGSKQPAAVETEKPTPTSLLLKFRQALTSGMYSLSWREEHGKPVSRLVAVNPPPSESDLDPISPSQLGDLLGNLKPIIQRYDSAGASLSTPPREIWRPLAMILLGLLAAEAVFAVWVGRER